MSIFLPRGGNSFTTPSHYLSPSPHQTPTHAFSPSATLSYVTSFSPLAILVLFIFFLNKCIRACKIEAISHCWLAFVNSHIQPHSTNHNSLQSNMTSLCYGFIYIKLVGFLEAYAILSQPLENTL